jgi:hypothetical protein
VEIGPGSCFVESVQQTVFLAAIQLLADHAQHYNLDRLLVDHGVTGPWMLRPLRESVGVGTAAVAVTVEGVKERARTTSGEGAWIKLAGPKSSKYWNSFGGDANGLY